ncbi:MAG: hypothetical protein JWQ02_1589 [Capsulimonas sp.]|nr:hypothetical protein [Capsulimonas sp.]
MGLAVGGCRPSSPMFAGTRIMMDAPVDGAVVMIPAGSLGENAPESSLANSHGRLFLDDKDFGAVVKGDKVIIAEGGRVFVNNTERKSQSH